MSNSAIQSPLGINATGALIQNEGLCINPVAAGYIGSSTSNTDYTLGTLITDTCLNKLTNAIKLAYNLIGPVLSASVYNNLISIGVNSIPALGNAKPNSYTYTGKVNTGYADQTGQSLYWNPYDNTNAVTQWGFIRLLALQAWYEFNWNGDSAASPTPNTTPEYKDFVSSFQIASTFIDQTNNTINTLKTGSTFLSGTYSNMNDLISADISGVSLATNTFGQDLIALGKAIDLKTISSFGLPSNLLRTLRKYNAITQSLSLALLAAGLSVNEISQLASGTIGANSQQERQIYGAYLIIVGVDLAAILVPLNCKTKGIESLADLLDVKKLFPNSYKSLTVPIYNTTVGLPTNSKTYYPIYDGNAINGRLNTPTVRNQVGIIIPIGIPPVTNQTSGTFKLPEPGFASYLANILPDDAATAAGAFSISMQQISNIQQADIEKFAQVVTSTETTRGLNLINGTNTPVNQSLAASAYNSIAKGSGPDGLYTVSDFFGAMSGLPYYWKEIYNNITNIQTSTLSTIYEDLYNELDVPSAPNIDTIVQGYIDAANAEILDIQSKNEQTTMNLNSIYSLVGQQLGIEQAARYAGIPPVPVPRDTLLNPTPSSIFNFVNSIPDLSVSTLPHMYAQTLEAISDLSTVGGQSIVGLCRQSRNQTRLEKLGVPLDNNVPETLNPKVEQLLVANGTVPGAINGIEVNGTTFTAPAVLLNNSDAGEVAPNPCGYFDPNTEQYMHASGSTQVGQQSPIAEILATTNLPPNSLGPANNGTGPAQMLNVSGPTFQTGTDVLRPDQFQTAPIAVIRAGARLPTGTATPLDIGNADVPGSFAGSPVTDLIPYNLNTCYTSGILSPSNFTVQEALDDVIACNCDCWADL